ncbi:MAG: methyltransferase domain-containing protein [Myxococcota bacterium]
MSCGACGAPLPAPILDLGHVPLANAYLDRPDADEATYPLAIARCPPCGLVQLTTIVPPEALFSSYTYLSSVSRSYVEHARELCDTLVRRHALGPASRVVEVASNDGYLLRHFADRGVPALGIEPARNIAEIANARGLSTWCAFFDAAAAERVRRELGPVDLLVGNNVLAHAPGVVPFLRAARDVLAEEGHAVFEVPSLRALLDHVAFDTIYHEHVYYFSVGALRAVGERAGLRLVDVETLAVHGGSSRVTFAREGRPSAAVDAALLEEADLDRDLGRFADRVERARTELRALLERLHAAGKTVGAYGAPAKGNTLLNAAGIDARLVAFTVDRNPLKQGRWLPGSRIPILPGEALLARQPDYALLLPWNLFDEIRAQEAEYLARGGRFVLPLPRPVVFPPEPT